MEILCFFFSGQTSCQLSTSHESNIHTGFLFHTFPLSLPPLPFLLCVSSMCTVQHLFPVTSPRLVPMVPQQGTSMLPPHCLLCYSAASSISASLPAKPLLGRNHLHTAEHCVLLLGELSHTGAHLKFLCISHLTNEQPACRY